MGHKIAFFKLICVIFCIFGNATTGQAEDKLPTISALKMFEEFNSTIANDADAALALADQILAQNDNPDLRLIFAKAAVKVGQATRAITYLATLPDEFTQTDPRLTEVFDLLAQAHGLLDQNETSLEFELLAFNSAKSRMGGENGSLLTRLDALELKLNKLRPALLPELAKMRKDIQQGNLPSGNVRGEGEPTAVTVWYGTNRNTTGSEDPAQYFGTTPDNLTVGKMVVTIPDHHLTGLIERPSLWSFTKHADPKKHVVLAKISQMAQDAFTNGCCSKDDRLLFIHGYNVSFHDGALRAAQLSYDLEFSGEMLYYSWPSQASLYGYLTDAKNVTNSRPAMETFLEMATRGKGKLHIIAHSMGNQYILSALEGLMLTHPDRNIGQLVLAAPDVDRSDFIERYNKLTGRVAGITLYASKHDRALQISHHVNGGRRLGDATGDIVQLMGMVTVDASQIEVDMLGHSYFGDAPQLLGDILGLVKLGWEPEERCGVAQRLSGSPSNLWEVQIDGCPVEQVRTAGDLIQKFGVGARAEAKRRFDNASGDQLEFWQGVLVVVDKRVSK